MDRDTQIFYEGEDGNFVPEEHFYEPDMEGYADDSEGYYQEDDEGGFNGYDVYGEDTYAEENADYFEEDEPKRFHIAMNVFDTASIVMGMVVIFALTTLIVSIVSWLQADITHTFVILQSRVQ